MKDEANEISHCSKCNCMTKSIRLGRAKFQCGKCGNDKSLSDYYFYEQKEAKHGKRTKKENLYYEPRRN